MVVEQNDDINTICIFFKLQNEKRTTVIITVVLRKIIIINKNKQLFDEVFVICGIINVGVRVIETLIILHITKTESNNCFIIDFKPKIINIARKNIVQKLAYYLRNTDWFQRCSEFSFFDKPVIILFTIFLLISVKD